MESRGITEMGCGVERERLRLLHAALFFTITECIAALRLCIGRSVENLLRLPQRFAFRVSTDTSTYHGYGQAKQRVIHPGDLARESDHIAAQTPHDGAPVVLHCPCRRRHGRESASLSPRQRQTHRDILLLQVQLHSGRDGILDEAAHEVERVSPPQVAVKPRIPPQNSADLATDATRARQTLGVQEAQHQDEWSGAERERKVHSLAALHAKIEGGVGQSEAVPGVAEPSERKRRHVHSKEL
eukprot:scaffold2785_cov291-Pinguiococcus_pyrenoidosus.AAC.5